MSYEHGAERVYAAPAPMRRVTLSWPFGRTSRLSVPLLLASLAGIVSCASFQNAERKRLPDGSYELTCRSRLSLCLVEMQDSCTDAGYDVLDASEERKRAGPPTAEVETIRSRARIRCRKATAVFGSPEPEAPPIPSSAAPPPVPPPPPAVCQPGATQVCVGTGACQGGQQCLPDGSGFGACDCGPPATAVPPENPPPLPGSASPSAAPPPLPAPAGTAPKSPGP